MSESLRVLGLVLLGAALVLAGFDLDIDIARSGEVTLRPLHVVSLGVVVVGGIGLLVQPGLRQPGSVRVVALCVVTAVSALLIASTVSTFGGAATQGTIDLCTVFLVLVGALGILRSGDDLLVVAALIVSAVLAGAVAVVTHIGDADWLFGDLYRGRVTRLDGNDRLTRPFIHANVAAMYFAPMAVGALALAASRKGVRTVLAGCLAVAMVWLTVLTASRAGMIAVVITALLLTMLYDRDRRMLIIGLVVVGFAIAYGQSPAVRGRASSAQRFATTIEAPNHFVLTAADELSIGVRNESATTWPSDGADRIVLTARWRDPSQTTQWLTQVWPLPQDMAPNEQVEVEPTVAQDVPDGDYVVIWDLLLDNEAFFEESVGRQTVSQVTVVGSLVEPFEGERVVPPRQIPSRRQIWTWSVDLFRQRPLWGHGPAMMRFAAADLSRSKSLVSPSHAHNLVLEPISASGLIGGVPIVGLILALSVSLATRLRRSTRTAQGFGLMLVAMLVHGLVEWPLMFPSLGVLASVLVAMWVHSSREMMAL